MNFSVVIPAYNAQKTIGQAVRSVYNQTLPPKEIIVIDDGSTDNTAIYLQKEFPEICVIKFKSNQGVSATRNKGLELATGEWIAFLDADDLWQPQKLEIISKVIQDNNFTVLFHPFTDEASPPKQQKEIPPIKELNFWPELLRNKVQGSCLCIKKDSGIRFNESFRYCEDHELAVRQSWKHKVGLLPVTLTRLGRPQLAKGGLSADLWQMRKGEMKIYLRLYRINLLLIPIIPLLLLWSLSKFFRQSFKTP